MLPSNDLVLTVRPNLVKTKSISRHGVLVYVIDHPGNLVPLHFRPEDQRIDICSEFLIGLLVSGRGIDIDQLEVVNQCGIPKRVPCMESIEICIFQFEPGFRINGDSAGRIDHLVDADRVGLEPDGHAPLGEVTDVVFVDVVFATRTLDELDIGGVELEFEELSERVPLHLLRGQHGWSNRTAKPTSTPGGEEVGGIQVMGPSGSIGLVPLVDGNHQLRVVVYKDFAVFCHRLVATFREAYRFWVEELYKGVIDRRIDELSEREVVFPIKCDVIKLRLRAGLLALVIHCRHFTLPQSNALVLLYDEVVLVLP